MSLLTEKFFSRLRNELKINVPSDAYVKRTYAGHWQRAAGAWTSVISSNQKSLFEIGLWSSITNLIKCPNLEAYDFYGLSVDCGCKGKCRGKKGLKE